MPFVALPPNGYGKDRQSVLLAFRFTATAKTYRVSNVSEVLRADSGTSDRDRIAELFTFKRYADFQNWIRAVIPIAHDIEHLAPALASNGPNPEYPWPHAQPEFAPANHNFAIWPTLTSGRGRDLMRIIHIAVDRFPDYADT